MQKRLLGRTGREVSEVGFGAWQIGDSDWGKVDSSAAMATLNAAVDSGVDFIDTADVYGDGTSEELVGRLLVERSEDLFVATKMGRRMDQVPENYNLTNFRHWLDRSRRNLGVDTIDLVQLHCPPSETYDDNEVFDALDLLVQEEVIANYGVSVETVDQAMTAIARDRVASVQIIFNAFRQKPLDRVLPAAAKNNVGIIARVPLASGLLSGKYKSDTQFAETDHRNYNRNGDAFDVGETFAGVDYETGLQAVEELRDLVPGNSSMAQWALRWILMSEAVTTVIPGARNPEQAIANAQAVDLPALSEKEMAAVQDVYDRYIKPQVGNRW